MTRLNVLLGVALILSALYLVKISYESRRLFSELDHARAESLRLASDHERLQLDRQSQAAPQRVSRVAREKLAMRGSTPAVTEYVDAPPATAPATPAGARR